MLKLKVKKKKNHIESRLPERGKNKAACWPLKGRKIHQERKMLSALRVC